jgi:hypothetical protein
VMNKPEQRHLALDVHFSLCILFVSELCFCGDIAGKSSFT